MIRYRSFLNSDPQRLAEIWAQQPPQRALAQHVSPNDLERLVFAKPYFDRHGLIVATENDRPIGFAHAGFGPDESEATMAYTRGVTCMVMVAAHDEQPRIRRELLQASEQYLVEHGARVLFGGAVFPLNPFYLGLYGGSDLPGILASDQEAQRLFASMGYSPTAPRRVFQRSLVGFRPVVDRDQMRIRRTYHVEAEFDPRCKTWWEACTYGQTERTRFSLVPRSGGSPVGSLVLWDMEPLASSWGAHAAGILSLEIKVEHRQHGLATFLLGDALRQVQGQGVTLVEAQVSGDMTAGVSLLGKLSFEQSDEGNSFVKEV